MIDHSEKPPHVFQSKGPLDESIIAQLIMCGLTARYGRDPDGSKWAQAALADELRQRGWTLPPFSAG
jgi:hypothetical protein